MYNCDHLYYLADYWEVSPTVCMINCSGMQIQCLVIFMLGMREREREQNLTPLQMNLICESNVKQGPCARIEHI